VYKSPADVLHRIHEDGMVPGLTRLADAAPFKLQSIRRAGDEFADEPPGDRG